jgi:hypothetical protein
VIDTVQLQYIHRYSGKVPIPSNCVSNHGGMVCFFFQLLALSISFLVQRHGADAIKISATKGGTVGVVVARNDMMCVG